MTCMYIVGHLFTRILLPIVLITLLSVLFITWIMTPETQKGNQIHFQCNKKSATSIGSRRDA